MDSLVIRIAAIVDTERRAAKISQHSLARRIGISDRTLQRRLGGASAFTIEELLIVANVLKCRPETLYAGAASPSN